MTMIPEPAAGAPSTAAPDAVVIARIEGKIDLLIQSVTDLHDDSKDHETRLRKIETSYVTADRVRVIESSYVTRGAVLAWLSLIAVVMGVAVAAVALIVNTGR